MLSAILITSIINMLAQAVATATRATSLQLAVCGLHLRGQPLNSQLTDLQAVFVRDCKSAAEYKCVLKGWRLRR